MDTIIEIFGYIGSAFVVVSMLMSSIVKLRVINTVGCVISVVYSIIVGAIPLALMNACLIIINVYNLIKLGKNSKVYSLVDAENDNAVSYYFCKKYEDDIKKYFPQFDLVGISQMNAYVVYCEDAIAGIMLGQLDGDAFQVEIDYTTPAYRDCSVGKFLYDQLSNYGIKNLVYAKELTPEHENYLKKMGFYNISGYYEKQIY